MMNQNYTLGCLIIVGVEGGRRGGGGQKFKIINRQGGLIKRGGVGKYNW